jgi:23S rRNA (uracil747-C5)-methyltransferase
LPADGIAETLIIPSEPWGSRNKVKMSITGSTAEPVIGIVRSDLSSIDLRACPLMPPDIQTLCKDIPHFISAASLTPYDVVKRTGELKGALIVINHDHSQGSLRFVLRSSEAIPRIRKILPRIQAAHPWVRVISCNIQPLPAAILEGPEEILLTPDTYIEELYGTVRVLFAPRSFMQVTHEVAQELYGAAAEYVRSKRFSNALDLFCGVGGFSYSIAPFVGAVTGVELSEDAIQSATNAATLNAVPTPRFYAADVEHFLNTETLTDIDLVVVNPPRRGLSAGIIDHLKRLKPKSIIYSSCNPETFARDVQMLCSGTTYGLNSVQAFDMFPLTHHCEVLGVIERQ